MFGQPTTSANLFGGFGTSAPANTQSAFSFGAPAPASTSSTGFSFGAPAQGSVFGTTSTAPSFGTNTSSTGFSFGAPTSSAFSFGSTAPATSSTGLSFGQFGTAGTGSGSLFPGQGTGATTTTTSSKPFSGFGFGSNVGQQGGGLFGVQQQSGTGLFGQSSQPSTGGLFGSTAGQTGGLFGTSGTTFGTSFGATQSQLQQQQDPNIAVTQLAQALTAPQLFNDERDGLIATFNQMQAFWGTGKGFYSNNAQPIPFTPENPFCKLRAVGYNSLPTAKPEDGLVILVIDLAEEEVSKNHAKITETLNRVLGSKPNLSVNIQSARPVSPTKTELELFVMEKSSVPGGSSRKIPSPDLCAFFEQPAVRQQLNQIAVSAIIAKVTPTKAMIDEYLKNPPAGIDILVWNQAKADNPDPNKFIPVPIIGFGELSQRAKMQQHELEQHKAKLNSIRKTIDDLRNQNATMLTKIEEFNRRNQEQGHRLLKVMTRQEVARKQGIGIQPEEERLRSALEEISAHLASPQLRGRLNQLVTRIKVDQSGTVASGTKYPPAALEDSVQNDVSEALCVQQQCISQLVGVLDEFKKVVDGAAVVPPSGQDAKVKVES